MSFDERSALTLGDLLRAGVSLYTREAAAVVAEVCRLVFYTNEPFAPKVDSVRIHPDGSLTIAPTVASSAEEQMAALAALLEALLPPLGSSEPDYAVRASLRILAPRTRGRPGLPPIQAPETLGAELSQYATPEPIAVLRGLWARADRALHQYLSSVGGDTRSTAGAVRAAAAARESLSHHVNAPQQDIVAESAEPSARTNSVRRHSALAGIAVQLSAVLLFTVGFAGGTWLGNQAYSHSPPPKSATESGPSRSGATPAAGGAISRRSDGQHHKVVPPMSSALGARRLGPAPLDLLDVKGPAFSPSFADGGRELVFHVGRDPVARVVSAQLGPEGRARSTVVLSDDQARTYHARRSPDGQFVSFDSDRQGERAVYVARRDWSEVTRVSGPGMAALPSWSPDMKWLAFVRGEPGRGRVWNLWLREMRTGALTRLTSYRLGQTWNASWFPDSRRVCYSHEDRLVVLDVTTRDTFWFRSPRRGRLVRTPAISPDGERVVFQVYKDGVWLLDLADGSMRRVLDDPSAEEFSWAPDGKHVAYHSHRDGTWRIWLMPAPA